MSISADGALRKGSLGGARAAAAPAVQAGFTLLEIMVSVVILGIVILPILWIREEAQIRAHRAQRMLEAAHLAQEFLAQRIRDVTSVREERGVLEVDPRFRYEFTLENFDLSTGFSEDRDPYREDQLLKPPDGELGAEEERTPYMLRRYTLVLTWDGYLDESEEERYALEGFLPRIWDPDKTSKGSTSKGSSPSGSSSTSPGRPGTQ